MNIFLEPKYVTEKIPEDIQENRRGAKVNHIQFLLPYLPSKMVKMFNTISVSPTPTSSAPTRVSPADVMSE